MAELEQPEQYLGGQALARDRGTTAKQTTFEIGDWKFRTNYVDYSGYDVQKKPIPEQLRKSLEEVFEEEPKRLVGVIKKYKQTKITDWQSFKNAFQQVFSRGGDGGTRFFDYAQGQEDLMMDLFAHPDIQELITEEGEEEGAKKIQQSFAHIRKITDREAREIWKQKRRHEIQLVAKGWFPVHDYAQKDYKMPRLDGRMSPKARTGYLIAQNTKKGGTLYRRSKPKRFNKAQERFLTQNPNVPASKLTAQFNLIFDTHRTQQSIYFKRYRLLK